MMKKSKVVILTLDLLPQPPDGASNGDGTSCVHGVSTTGLDLAAILASPDTNSLSLDTVLAAELTEVLAVLADFHLLDLLPDTRTISSTVLADDSNLLRSLRHFRNGALPPNV